MSQRSSVAKQEMLEQDIPWNNDPSYLSVVSQHLPPSPAAPQASPEQAAAAEVLESDEKEPGQSLPSTPGLALQAWGGH